jgi:hypothetical protein
MRKLDRQCQCPPCSSDPVCPACNKWWQLNAKLNTVLGVGGPWIPCYEAPDHECERDYTPKQSAIDRFHLLERAASKAAKKPKFKYKWEK